MSIASEITRLQGVKADILQAISDEGVEVPVGSALDDCPGLIASIGAGGGSFEDISNDCTSDLTLGVKKIIKTGNILLIDIRIIGSGSGNSKISNVLTIPNNIKFKGRVYISGIGSNNSYLYQLNNTINGFLSNCLGDIYATKENGTIKTNQLDMICSTSWNWMIFNGWAEIEKS